MSFQMAAGGQQCLQGTQEKASMVLVMAYLQPKRKKENHYFMPVSHFLLFIMTQIICYGTHRLRKPVFCLETTSGML